MLMKLRELWLDQRGNVLEYLLLTVLVCGVGFTIIKNYYISPIEKQAPKIGANIETWTTSPTTTP